MWCIGMEFFPYLCTIFKIMKKISILVLGILLVSMMLLAKTPIRYLAQDIITKQLGVSNGQVFTEKDLSDAQLAELNKQIRFNIPNKPVDVSVLERNFNSAYQVQNILGKYSITYFDDHCIITDVYDFNKKSKKSKDPVVNFFETIAEKYGHSDNDTYNSKMKFNIKIVY